MGPFVKCVFNPGSNAKLHNRKRKHHVPRSSAERIGTRSPVRFKAKLALRKECAVSVHGGA